MLEDIGEFGPLLLFILTVFLLSNKQIFLAYYLIGIFINTIINIFLKLLICDPRPSSDIVDRLKFDKYGMPSGHSQSVGFSTAYIFCTLNSQSIFVLYSIISLITMFQRYKNHCHTISQIVIGYIIGIVFGILIIYIASYKIKGVIHCKQDDNSFVL